MEKKEFNKLTKEIFLEYGFKKVKNNYFTLPIKDITIVVAFRSWRTIRSFNYYFYINEYYDDSISLFFNCAMITEIKMEHTPELRGYLAHEITFEKYSEIEYKEMLTNMLHRYFDPWKKDAVQFIKDNANILLLTKEAKEYFNVN